MGFFILIIILVVVGYFISLRLHPLVKCKVCKGTGRHFGSVYTYAQRRCNKCGGNGRVDRLGVRLFH